MGGLTREGGLELRGCCGPTGSGVDIVCFLDAASVSGAAAAEPKQPEQQEEGKQGEGVDDGDWGTPRPGTQAEYDQYCRVINL